MPNAHLACDSAILPLGIYSSEVSLVPGMWGMPLNPTLEKVKPEDKEFEASLGYVHSATTRK